MASSRSVPAPGWFPVARAADVGTTPVPVGAGGQAWVVLRLRPGGEVTAFSPRCPHRLTTLTAATVVGGQLRCAGHGWRFAADGRCTEVPALGPHAVPPPRADLTTPWAVEERDGWVWLAPDRTAQQRPPRAGADTVAEPVPALPPPGGPVLDNLAPALAHAWHPVAAADQLAPGGWLSVRLLGRTWTLERRDDGIAVAPAAWGVREREGMVWVAPGRPVATDLGATGVGRAQWLPPLRTATPAAVLLDALLGPGRQVHTLSGGFTGTWETDDLRVRTEVAAPFQLLRRVEPAGGPVRWELVLLQPEDGDCTRVHARVSVEGRVTRPDLTAAALRLQAAVSRLDPADRGRGLPLTPRDEVHVATDALGAALRTTLADLVVAARRTDQEEDDDVAAA
ncbi:Rieske 2Fe-2S domain-containing protein [Klenkia sp. LSe6-5]|uniref:Rieske 2Fe-2S domain-containing protein n=1 Tax=Klenkia sesuvii TaxID=3103137 RepID=A0ABU8DWV4_9ACTN